MRHEVAPILRRAAVLYASVDDSPATHQSITELRTSAREALRRAGKAFRPGSPAALDLGCPCPTVDNGHGTVDERGEVRRGDCMLHGSMPVG